MKRNIGHSAIEVMVAWLCVIGLVIISVWSFIQTRNFFESAVNDSIVAYGLAFAFQYGQNFLLFLKNRAQGPNWVLACVVGFVIAASIDAGTNVAELFRANPSLADNAVAMVIMVIVAVAVVFVEEVMAMAFAWALNNTNELIKSSGGETIDALEWLETEARKFDPRDAR